MKFDLETLARILPGMKCINLRGNENFDILNIAHLKQFESMFPNDRTLYFCVYEDNPKQMGWYNKPFDRSLNIQKINTRERIVFVVDNRVSDDWLARVRYIRVDNIYHAINRIRRYILSVINPQTSNTTNSLFMDSQFSRTNTSSSGLGIFNVSQESH